MDYVRLGSTGLEVSRLCYGTWRFGEETEGVVETPREEAHELLDTAWERGINFIDTANSYGTPPGTSEEIIGEWLAERDREDFVIATKVGMSTDADRNTNADGLSRKHIRWQIEASLDRLGTDYVDVYYIHRLDGRTPMEETLSTLNELVSEGKVRYLGASTMAAWQLTKLLWQSDVKDWEPIRVTQPPMDASLQNWQRYEGFDLPRYLEVCVDQGLAVVPYSPLAGGFLTGKYERGSDDPTDLVGPEGSRGAMLPGAFERKYLSEPSWAVLDAIREIADEIDATPAQVALGWLFEQERFGTVVPIVGARTPEQLAENAAATEIDLSDDQVARIDEARGRSL